LFATKTNLFKAAITRRRSETLQAFEAAAEGRQGPQALDAIAARYVELLHDRPRLLGRLQATGAGDDQRDHDPFGPQGSPRWTKRLSASATLVEAFRRRCQASSNDQASSAGRATTRLFSP
jgi:hypothetical protein